MPTEIGNAFAEALVHARNKAKMSQTELALRSSLNRSFISMLERGIRKPSLETVILLGEALGLTLSAFVTDIEARIPSPQINNKFANKISHIYH